METMQFGSVHAFQFRWSTIVLIGALVMVIFFVVIVYRGYGTEIHGSSSGPPHEFGDFFLGDYYFNYGLHADGTYDLVKARAHYERGLTRQPDGDSDAWYQLGRIDFLEGKFDAAIYKFKQQLEYFGDKQLPNVYYMLGLTHGYRARYEGSDRDWREAEKYFIEYLTHDPESPWAATDLAWVYFAQGKYEEMIPVLETGLTYSPENPWVNNMYGLALLNTGNNAEARVHFLRAQAAAKQLTVEDWSRSYPGNDPLVWGDGLREFNDTIARNIQLVE